MCYYVVTCLHYVLHVITFSECYKIGTRDRVKRLICTMNNGEVIKSLFRKQKNLLKTRVKGPFFRSQSNLYVETCFL